ncbi:hypothetical protein LEMLEM_LOCUS24893 [Lemmus lemmus]
MRTCHLRHQYIPQRMLSREDTPLGACFLLGKTDLWARNCPCNDH